MAKNSDKRSVVAKRKLELLHALRHEYSAEQVFTRVEKLRFAVAKFIKKEINRTATGSPALPNDLTEKWHSIAADEVIEIAKDWPETPSIKDMQI